MNEKLRYPARTVMKIIATAHQDNTSEEMLQKDIERVFHGLLLTPKDWRHRRSRQGTYVSYTTTVYIQNKEQLKNLYEKLLAMPQVKQVL